MPRLDGIEATRQIVAASGANGPRVLILLDEHVYAGLHAGASGFLLKDVPPAELVGAVRAVAVVAPSVTRRLLEAYAHRLPTHPAPATSGAGHPALVTLTPQDPRQTLPKARPPRAGPRGHPRLRDRAVAATRATTSVVPRLILTPIGGYPTWPPTPRAGSRSLLAGTTRQAERRLVGGRPRLTRGCSCSDARGAGADGGAVRGCHPQHHRRASPVLHRAGNLVVRLDQPELRPLAFRETPPAQSAESLPLLSYALEIEHTRRSIGLGLRDLPGDSGLQDLAVALGTSTSLHARTGREAGAPRRGQVARASRFVSAASGRFLLAQTTICPSARCSTVCTTGTTGTEVASPQPPRTPAAIRTTVSRCVIGRHATKPDLS